MRKIFRSGPIIFFIGLLLSTSCISQKSKKLYSDPDIVLIYMDDVGYDDVYGYGGIDYVTPNIDKLAAGSMRFTNFYAAQPICIASRVGLFTGCSPNRIGLYGSLRPYSKIGISDKAVTIAQMLKKEGYATGIIGKWHLGVTKKFLPLQPGFDEYFGLLYSNDMWPVNYDGKLIKILTITGQLPAVALNGG